MFLHTYTYTYIKREINNHTMTFLVNFRKFHNFHNFLGKIKDNISYIRNRICIYGF